MEKKQTKEEENQDQAYQNIGMIENNLSNNIFMPSNQQYLTYYHNLITPEGEVVLPFTNGQYENLNHIVRLYLNSLLFTQKCQYVP
jgi:hypothetical protein